MRLTWKHLNKARLQPPVPVQQQGYLRPEGSVTLAYPTHKPFVPETGRYRLHMETEDCIVCDKCARICPVNCIEIESIKSSDDLGLTSDGSRKRLHLARFDIDMAQCCYCGLCTTVCPTECLTMTRVFDFPETDRSRFIYHFGALSPEEAARIRVEEAEKAAQKKSSVIVAEESGLPVVKSRIPGKLPVRKPVDTPVDQSKTPKEQVTPIERKMPPGMKKLPVRKSESLPKPETEEALTQEEKSSTLQGTEILPSTEVKPRPLPKLKKPIIRRPEDPPQE